MADRPGGTGPGRHARSLSGVALGSDAAADDDSRTQHPISTAFRKRWPTVRKLAAAKWEDVSAAWAGLGYYSRARNLHACAKAVAERGGFPQDAKGLRELPGMGPYTAGAIASIAFGEAGGAGGRAISSGLSRGCGRSASDGTRERVAGRQGGDRRRVRSRWPNALPRWTCAGDLAQALMDLGATVCTPRKPNCLICPLSGFLRCAGRGRSRALSGEGGEEGATGATWVGLRAGARR